MLRALKRKLFSSVRNGHLGDKIRDIDNFLRNTAVEIGLPRGNPDRVLVLSPHPDDESIGCGGTLAQYSRLRVPVDIVFFSCGDLRSGVPSNDPHTRREEAHDAARALGVSVRAILSGQDGELHRREGALAAELGRRVRLDDYGIVFSPWPHDGHSDHSAVFRIYQAALRSSSATPRSLLYETWSPVLANRVVNIDSTVTRKMEAIGAHVSQVQLIDYRDKALALANYRSLICPGSKHAEAFFEAEREVVLEMGASSDVDLESTQGRGHLAA